MASASDLDLSQLAPDADRDVPPAGTACVLCRSADGHFCPAKEYNLNGKPVCVACFNVEPCSALLARQRKAEPELADLDAEPHGEVRSVGLGTLDAATAAVAPVPDDRPVDLDLSPGSPRPERDEAEYQRKLAEAAKLIRDVEARRNGSVPKVKRGPGRPPKLRQIDGELVDMAEHAVMGAELLSPQRPIRRHSVDVKAMAAPKQPLFRKAEQVNKKKCRHPECSALTKAKSGVCGKHWWWGSRGAGRLDGAREADRPAPKTPVAEKAAGPAPAVWDGDKDGMAVLQVPNAALDRFWAALSWEEKAQIIARQIAGV